MSSKPTPNEIGKALEQHVAAVTGGRVTPQSGGGSFVKLDNKDKGRFAYSCKATTKIRETALRAIYHLWLEAVKGARGPAGHGDGAKPAMVFELEGEVLVLCRLQDHVDLATGEIEAYIQPSKAQERRHKVTRSPMG